MRGPERIEIDLGSQTLRLLDQADELACYAVSTAVNGAGEVMDSECTPRGRHEISEKIGAGCVPNTVFVGRRPTGEIYDAALAAAHPGRDWILTRILWLAGCEPGHNAGGDRDTKARYIYIHGTPDDTELGKPGSRGCIRMRNADLIELFDRVTEGMPVTILG
ncbi:MAG: L,D-transpeptidase family protein [Gammaproteobacteria bacterium]